MAAGLTDTGATGGPGMGGIRISRRHVVVNSASFVLARLINVLVIVWVYQFLLKRIPADEFAVYPVVASVMVIAPVFFTAFTGGIARNAIDAVARRDDAKVTRIVSSIFPLILGITLAFVSLGLLLALNIEDVLNIPADMVMQARIMMALLVLAFAVQSILVPFQIGFQIHQKFVELNVLALAREMLRLAVLVLLLWLLGPAVIWVVVAAFVADVAYAVVQTARSRQLVPGLKFVWGEMDLGEARNLVSFGLWVSLGQLGMVMYTHAATIVLNLYATPQQVTVYFVGATMFRQLQTLVRVAIQPLLPVITAMQATQDIARVRRTLIEGGRLALWVTLLPAVALMVYAEEFVRLYAGEAYIGAAWVIVLFMAILPFDRATTLLPMTCMAMAKVRAFFLPAFFFQLLGLVLMVIFAGPMGLGAVGVTAALVAITIASQLSYYWRLSIRISDATWREFLLSVIVLGWMPGVFGFVAWWAIGGLWSIDSWARLFASGAMGAVVYGKAILLLSLSDGAQLLGALPWRRRRVKGG